MTWFACSCTQESLDFFGTEVFGSLQPFYGLSYIDDNNSHYTVSEEDSEQRTRKDKEGGGHALTQDRSPISVSA